MGFYGKITNLKDIHFQFDRIFTSRKAMDEAAATGMDNLFQGRFALVQYDPDVNSDFTANDTLFGFRNPNNGVMYADANYRYPYIYSTFTQVNSPNASDWNSYFYFDGRYYYKLPSADYFNDSEENYFTPDVTDVANIVSLNQLLRLRDSTGSPTGAYYKCTGTTSGEIATWEPVQFDENFPRYITNFNLDKVTYGPAFDVRGYDGTVWEKVFSGGQGRFVLIARLNGGLMPALELHPDPPDISPRAPYIDTQSTEAMYRIHVPSMFGFVVKEEEDENLSDQQVTVNKISWNSTTGEYEEILTDIDAAIYFNKAAGDKLHRTVDEETINEVLIQPTGESGRVYYDGEGNTVTKDLLELTVHLPMIGNMVAEGYDLIYGANPKQGDNPQTRPTDIEWISGDADETVKLQGSGDKGGKTHDLATLAGTLNTMHDRLGQIVVHHDDMPSAEMIGQLSPTLIHEINNTFYRKGIGYEILPVPESWYRYESVSSVDNPFPSNKYYISDGEGGYIPATTYDSNLTYYLKNLEEIRYEPISLQQYTAGHYYYTNGVESSALINYYRDNTPLQPFDPNRTYFEINHVTSRTFTLEYTNDGTFFVKNKNGDNGIYTPCTETIPIVDATYYIIEEGESTDGNTYYYEPGVFFFVNNQNEYELDNNPTWRSHNHSDPSLSGYWVLKFSDVPSYGIGPSGTVIIYYPVEERKRVTVIAKPNDIADRYFKNELGEYVPYSYIPQLGIIDGQSPYTVARKYYLLTIQNIPSSRLYIRGVNYIQDENGSYLVSNDAWVRGKTYYNILPEDVVAVSDPFYIPNKYYYKVGNEYVLDDQLPPSRNTKTDYFVKKKIYVDVDTSLVDPCPHGFEWNDRSDYIPPSISLYQKNEVPALIEIVGAGAITGLSETASVNAILLNLHKEYDPNNTETRDPRTFRGEVNSIADMFYKIKELVPGEILTVDTFGRIVSMSLADLKAALNRV